MLLKEKGYSVPLVLIVVLVLLAVPLSYWLSSNSNNSSQNNVRGVASPNTTRSNLGFSVSVSAASQTWDLVEYLCKNLEECTESLTAGRRLGTVSGGQADLHEVVVDYTKEWADYRYVKYFVRSGWYATNRDFKVINVGNIPGSQVYTLSDGADSFEVVIAPILEVSSKFFESAHFSDF